MRPFLCARRLLDVDQISHASHGRLRIDAVQREDARCLAREFGLRLPTESELEWLARDGGATRFILDAAARAGHASRFGVEQLFCGEWAEDDWHSTYDGAPNVSVPWGNGDPCGVFRAGYPPAQMQSGEEMLFALAAVRGKGTHQPTFVGMRLVADLPH